MRKIFIFFLLLLFSAAGVLYFAKDVVAQAVFKTAVRKLTGLEVDAKGVRLDLLNGILHVREAVLLNPYGFQKRIFADIPELYLQMDLPALFKKERVYMQELRLDVREFNVEKNPNGVYNVSSLTSFKKKGRATGPSVPSLPQRKMPFRLDRFELTLRRVTYNDRSSLVPKRLSVNIPPKKIVYEGIQDPRAIVNIIIMRVISETPFGNLGINPIAINRQLRKSVKTFGALGEKFLMEPGTEFAERGGEVGRKILEEGKATLAGVGNTTKQGIEDVFGNLKSKATIGTTGTVQKPKR